MTFSDKLVISVSFCLVVALYPLLWNYSAGNASEVEIGLPGGKKEILDLSRDGVYSIEGRLGSSVLEVSQGRVRFKVSPCNNKVCIKSGWLQKIGGFSACLPNGVSLFLAGGEEYDSINF